MNDLSHSHRAISEAAFLGLTVETADIVGRRVVSPQDVDLGKVDEVVMDAFNSRIAYVVVVYGGFLGIGRTRYAVPWSVLQFNNVQQVYVLNLTQDDIARLPPYEEGNWPDFSGDCWHRNERSYDEMTPFWMP